jgi:prevent-host-death family protein
MTIVVNVHEAKTHFSRLLEQAHGGQAILLAKAGKPYARLMPLEPGSIRHLNNPEDLRWKLRKTNLPTSEEAPRPACQSRFLEGAHVCLQFLAESDAFQKAHKVLRWLRSATVMSLNCLTGVVVETYLPGKFCVLGSPKTELTPAYRLHWLARTRWAGLEGA